MSQRDTIRELVDLQQRLERVEATERTGAYGCYAYKASATTIADSTTTALNFTSELYNDVSGLHSTSSNPSRITITRDGRYLVGGHITYTSNTTGSRNITIRKNGTDTIAGNTFPGSAGINTRLSIAAVFELVAGDYLELTTFQTSGGNLDILAHSVGAEQSFWIERLK